MTKKIKLKLKSKSKHKAISQKAKKNRKNTKNSLVKIPPHLQEYISNQDYNLYSAIDHATWRYIMRISRAFFKDHAHGKYLAGLEKTGITTERIPRISEMDEKLKKIGWRAVTVTGFIPPSIFLEFQSLSILAIACDMRNLEHIEYTPSPDIVHEAAGHAPIIADPKYASYLHKFGEIARKVIFAKEDIEIYEAIKYLSDIKEDPKTTEYEIAKAYKQLDEAKAKVHYASEAAKLSRVGWWTIEYGLVKKNDEYKIYGAGLLSSVGESYDAIMTDVKKVPLTIDCTNVDYDITKPQPQLFYVSNFKQLEKVIDQLAKTMAYKIGGMYGLKTAEKAGTVTTTQLETGLQISGVLSKIYESSGQPFYLQFSGPSQLSFHDTEIEGHSARYHREGFGMPIGKVKVFNKSGKFKLKSPAELSLAELKSMGFVLKKNKAVGKMQFASGVVVDGELTQQIKKNNKNLILSFKNCRVTYRDESLNEKVLFDPSWGAFDMACGTKVVSVYGGAADRVAYLKSTGNFNAIIKGQTTNVTEKNRKLVPLYAQVRAIRERGVETADFNDLVKISESLNQYFMDDWLLRFEIYELLTDKIFDADPRAKYLHAQLGEELERLCDKSKSTATLIQRGMELLN